MQKYDLDTHFFTNWEKGKFSLERKERSPENILDAMRKIRKKLGFVNLEEAY